MLLTAFSPASFTSPLVGRGAHDGDHRRHQQHHRRTRGAAVITVLNELLRRVENGVDIVGLHLKTATGMSARRARHRADRDAPLAPAGLLSAYELQFESDATTAGRAPTAAPRSQPHRRNPCQPTRLTSSWPSTRRSAGSSTTPTRVLWDQSALDPVVKERMRIALAEAIGCSYCVRFRTDLDGSRSSTAERAAADRGRAARPSWRSRVRSRVFGRGDRRADRRDAGRVHAAEFADLVFSIGWFIGMQHVGRLMHWDDVVPRRADPRAGGDRRGRVNFSLWLWPYGRWGGIEAMGRGGPARGGARLRRA